MFSYRKLVRNFGLHGDTLDRYTMPTRELMRTYIPVTARITLLIWISLVSGDALGQSGQSFSASAPNSNSVLRSPIAFPREGASLEGEEGLLFVPENRASKIAGRTIAVHFYRFRAIKDTGRAPVFFLPAGPGGFYNEGSFVGGHLTDALLKELDVYRQERDVVLLNQRGNPRAPGIQPNLVWEPQNQPLDKASSEQQTRMRIQAYVNAGIRKWTSRGVDLAGYDIMNITEDVEDLRKTLGYDKVCLRGTSFGSQWALAYLKLHPQRVDRMLLSGIEPLDHTYDSPSGIMRSLKTLEAKAMADEKLVASLPRSLVEVGLLESFRRVVEQLRAVPREVSFPSSSRANAPVLKVTLGGDDLPPTLLGFLARTKRESLQNWPSYIRDVVAGDLRLTAWMEYEDRRPRGGGVMIGLLIDNSLGISSARGQRLRSELADTWLGDVNLRYQNSKALTPTPVVSDDFRKPFKTAVPILMLHGDVDFSTPLSNAQELLPWLENGHLLVVEGGTHSAFRELLMERPELIDKVLAFMNADLSDKPAKFFSSLPKLVDLGISFRTSKTSLFDD